MSGEALPADWWLLPACHAHRTRLPVEYRAGTRRALRVASALLLAQVGPLPSGMRGPASVQARLAAVPDRWRRAALAAGVRALSAQLRKATGSALTDALCRELRPEPWRSALRWTGPGLDPVFELDGDAPTDRIACLGSEILLAPAEGAEEGFTARVRLMFPACAVRLCRGVVAQMQAAACVQIAQAVLAQEEP